MRVRTHARNLAGDGRVHQLIRAPGRAWCNRNVPHLPTFLEEALRARARPALFTVYRALCDEHTALRKWYRKICAEST